MTKHGSSTISNLAWKDVAEVVRCLPFQFIEKREAKKLYYRFYSRHDSEARQVRKVRAYTRHGSRDNFMRHKRARNYGLTGAELEQMEAAQNHVCAICGKPEMRTYRGKQRISLDIDHCHKSGKVRGLLCNACNRILANAYDDVDVLQKAIDYLNK